jgi:uncharacterized membrane protein YhaH (DUF805 family)
VTQGKNGWFGRIASWSRAPSPLPRDAPLSMRLRHGALRMVFFDTANFSGRINRTEFVSGIGLWLIWLFLIALISGPLREKGSDASALESFHIFLMLAVIFIPLAALMVRRLHDVDRHGWALVVVLIPYFGWAILLGLLLWKGNSDYNLFVPPPGLQTD